ncbi:MAG: methionine ABC transporter ATP-binding protein [Candidatus Ancillula sp.]|nr:methionine ABC transporter ATP-binding protein [Candidatus Ancillula sp.]
MALISFKNVSKTFITKHHFHKNEINSAVVDATFDIEEGEVFGVIGHSGAGKSTLVRLINQLEKTTSGILEVDGHQVGNLSEKDLKKLRSEIGMVFQQFNLFGAKNVLKNVEFPLKIAGETKENRQKKALELLDFVGLKDRARTFPGKLSGGQKQRVGIARALATNPKILLADEATSALDPETTLDVLRLLKKVNKKFGITIVLITHTMSVARIICDRIAVMDSGKIVEIGETDQVFNNPQHPTTKKFVQTMHALESGKLEDKEGGYNEN